MAERARGAGCRMKSGCFEMGWREEMQDGKEEREELWEKWGWRQWQGGRTVELRALRSN